MTARNAKIESSRGAPNRRLSVVYHPIDALRLDPRNPRVHSRKQIRQIARSIKIFRFNAPILVNGNLKVIAGHGRVLAAQELGLHEVPTICLEHLTEAQARAFTIADNRLTEISVWDDRLLAEQLKMLSELDLDFSLEAIGFEMGEIDLRIESLTGADSKDPDPSDAVPELPAGPAVAQLGDLWMLDRHRVYCGNALDGAAYRALMEGEQAAMVFTDPPYNVPIAGHASGLGAVKHKDFVMASGEMDQAEFTAFLTRAFGLLARNSVDGAIHFICMDWRHMAEMLAAGGQVYGELKNLCVWVKNNAGMGSLYRSQHELVFVFKHGRGRHRNNVELGQYGRHRSNVWRHPGVNTFRRQTEEGNLLTLHPTVKPVALVADAVMDCSARGDVVLDGFLGSGTTVIAAERVGRICYGLELAPAYVDTIIRRWQAWTGERARQAPTGRSFDDVWAERQDRHVG